MKKTIKLMLATALLSFGSIGAKAQIAVGDMFPDGDFVYKVTKAAVANGKAGEVKVIGIREGKNPIQSKVLVLKPTCEATVFEDKYSFTVTEIAYDDGDFEQDWGALQTIVTIKGAQVGTFTDQVYAESVEFPRYIKTIPEGALDGYTNMKTVTFADKSELTTVQAGAFATTQIEEFDFSNCKKLAGLGNTVFVEGGKINSYIKKVTLPGTTLFKTIGTAFASLTSLEEIEGLSESSVNEILTDAFNGDTKLKELTLPGTVVTIQNNAFRASGIETLTIDVTALTNLGTGAQVYGTTNVLKSLTLTGNLGGVIGANAFKGSTNLATLTLSGLNFASKGQIDNSAFEGCTKITTVTLGDILDMPAGGYTIAKEAFKGCTELTTFTVGNINSANAIDEEAFSGCSKLATVNIGNIVASNVIKNDAFKNCAKLATVNIGNINGANVIGADAFGNGTNELKTVKIGTVKAGAASIVPGAFKFADKSGATLTLATGTGEYVSSDDAATPVIATGAFDFTHVVNAGAATGWVWPVVNIGEIRSQGGAFAAGALIGNNIAQINFKGDIAKDGLKNADDKSIIQDNSADKTVESLAKFKTLVFDGTIGIAGVSTGAFADMPQVMEITFNGELAEGAVATAAFDNLLATSKVNYNKAELKDATVNPFDKQAFSDDPGVDETTARIIDFVVANEDLKDNYEDVSFQGLTTDGDFEIYLVKFYVPVVPDPDYNKFYVYQDGENNDKIAWARYDCPNWENLNHVINNKTIPRYQTLANGAKVKLTFYGTYTDDPGAPNGDPTVYMVPLKSIDGYYEIDNTTAEKVIIKAELTSGSFAEKNVELSFTAGTANDSWWGGLTNNDLFINPSIITNQQLIDKTKAVPVVGDVYNGTPNIAYDLYVINNPAKYKGFRIDKNRISKADKTYIGEGWWCMLLRKTTAAAAKIVWMDEDPTAIESILMKAGDVVKTVEGSDAIYNLQGMQISAPVKGQIYIKNGKKYFAK